MGDNKHTENIQWSTENHLHQLSYISHFGMEYPHKGGREGCTHYNMQFMTNNEKIVFGNKFWWIIYNIECKRLWNKCNKSLLTITKCWSSSKQENAVYMVGLEELFFVLFFLWTFSGNIRNWLQVLLSIRSNQGSNLTKSGVC